MDCDDFRAFYSAAAQSHEDADAAHEHVRGCVRCLAFVYDKNDLSETCGLLARERAHHDATHDARRVEREHERDARREEMLAGDDDVAE